MEEIRFLNESIQDLINKIKQNNLIINSTKPMKQDLFIYVRKIVSFVQNQYYFLRILQKCNQNYLLFSIIEMISIPTDEYTPRKRTVKREVINLIDDFDKKGTQLKNLAIGRGQIAT